jgi:NADH-quinone oxidoreductase subunit J
MSGELIVFFLLALTAIATAVGMLFSRSAVYAALYLVLNFSTVAIFYLLLDSPFIALSQVTVYAGAIMVLFLFVIMLLGVEHSRAEFQWQRTVPAIVLALLLMGESAYLMLYKLGLSANVSTTTGTFLADPAGAASMLFTEYLLPFEVTSILLLVAMIGAIVLTKQDKKERQG